MTVRRRAGALLLCAALAACGGPGPELQALRDDPAATLELPGTRLVSESEDSQQSHGLTGKPRSASLARVYAIADAAQAEAVVDAAIDQARSAGWEFREPSDSTPDGFYRAEKKLPTGQAQLTLTLFTDPEESRHGPPPTLRIGLTHDYKAR